MITKCPHCEERKYTVVSFDGGEFIEPILAFCCGFQIRVEDKKEGGHCKNTVAIKEEA